jgi:septal ring factor EnvC (AmiA/AmiB activator)
VFESGKEEDKLKRIQEEKIGLEKKRTEKKTALVQINSMIEKLYVNRDSAKKREEKLERIREEKRKKEVEASQKNRKFSTMKGKLPWPVEGSIIKNSGIGDKDGIKERNLFVEIKTKKGSMLRWSLMV